MTQPYGSDQLDIGRVISRTFSAVGSNFISFFLLSLIVAGVSTAVVTYVTQAYVMPAVIRGGGYSVTMALFIQFGSMIVLWIPTYVLIGAITHGSIAYLSGGRASLAESLGTGLSRMVPMIVLGFLSSLGMGFFLLLFIIPGVMAAVRWSVAAPALVAERIGPLEAFSRSGDLTRDNRWRIFWLFVIWMVVGFLIQLAVTAGMGFMVRSVDSFGPFTVWIYYGILAVYTAVTSMIGATGSAALYTELRTIKEGATTAELAKVFD